MKNGCFIFIFYLLWIHQIHAQSKRAHVWYMSEGIGYDFNCTPPCSSQNGAMKTSTSSSTICDINGNLQFYTDNETVWNSKHQIIENGMGMYSCRWSRQGSVIVPLTSNPYQYYLVSCDDLRYPVYANAPYICGDVNPVKYILSLSLIDMGANNGNGTVLWKNKVIYGSGHVNSMLAAVKHANTKDTWLMTYDFAIKRFVSLLLTDCGIQDTIISPDLGVKIEEGYSPITFSPKGDLMHVRTGYMFSGTGTGNMVAHFDNATGLLLTPKLFQGVTVQGCFSIDSRYLYTNGYTDTSGYDGYVNRYDLSIVDTAIIYSDRKIIMLLEKSGPNFGIQNGPDGKLYYLFNNYYLTWHMIDNPTQDNSTVSEKIIHITRPIDPTQNPSAPSFVQSWFDPDFKEYAYGSPSISYNRNCYTSPTTFTATGVPPATSFHWEIYEDSLPVAIYTNTKTITHQFSKGGIYTAKLIVDFSCMPDVISRNDIIIDAFPINDFIKDVAICTGSDYILTAQPNQIQYLWNTGNIDAQQTGSVDNTYTVLVSNTCGSNIDSVAITKLSYSLPNLITPNNDSYNDTFVVDAENKVPGNLEIYNAWGSRIYFNSAYQNTWPENTVESGVYYYRFTYSTCEPLNSWLQLIK